MLLCMIKSGNRDLQEWGASMVARAFSAVRLKRSFARRKGPVVLLKLIGDGGAAQDDNAVVLSSLHALLNLSTESSNQALIGRHGIEKLVQLSHDEDAPNQRGFSARIIANLMKHTDNRTPLYRQELAMKSAQWHDEVVETVGHVKEHKRRHLQSYDSKLNLKGGVTPAASVKDAFTDWVDALGEDPAVLASNHLTPRGPGGRVDVVAQAMLKQARSPLATQAGDADTQPQQKWKQRGSKPRGAASAKSVRHAPPGVDTSPSDGRAVDEALRKHPRYIQGLQRLLCRRALGNLSPGVGRPTSSVFLTATDDDGTSSPPQGRTGKARGKKRRVKKKSRTKTSQGGGTAAGVAKGGASRKATQPPRRAASFHGGSAPLRHSPVRRSRSTAADTNSGGSSSGGSPSARSRADPLATALDSPSSLSKARAEARQQLLRGARRKPRKGASPRLREGAAASGGGGGGGGSGGNNGGTGAAKVLGPPGAEIVTPRRSMPSNPFQHSLSAPLLASARNSKALRATHSSDNAANSTALKSKFRYHVRRALLKRQAPSFMRIVELARVRKAVVVCIVYSGCMRTMRFRLCTCRRRVCLCQNRWKKKRGNGLRAALLPKPQRGSGNP
mgnify:CR=1 FL=1